VFDVLALTNTTKKPRGDPVKNGKFEAGNIDSHKKPLKMLLQSNH